MKCDDYLPNLETGGPLRRLAASWHRLRCPRCREFDRNWRAALDELKRPAILEPRHRDAWLKAAGIAAPDAPVPPGAPAVARIPRSSETRFALALAAGLVLAVLVTQVGERPGAVTHLPPAKAGAVAGSSTTVVDPAGQLASMELKLNELDEAISSLKATAERLQARQQADDMLKKFAIR